MKIKKKNKTKITYFIGYNVSGQLIFILIRNSYNGEKMFKCKFLVWFIIQVHQYIINTKYKQTCPGNIFIYLLSHIPI